jgi:hypothetical protein
MPFQPTPPANLTAPLPDLLPLGEGANFGDLLRFSVDTSIQYRQCQARHRALAEWATTP